MGTVHPFDAWAGTWRGDGQGEYPTIDPFPYTEELVIEPVSARSVAHWRSHTTDARTREPRHAESGFIRTAAGGIELVVAHSFGIVEVATGILEGTVLDLRSENLGRTPSAKQVDVVGRHYELDADSILYTIAMAAVGQPLTHHLAATLRRSAG